MLDDKLRGRPHSAETVHDARGSVVYSDHMLDDRVGQGHEVTLTIDKTLQHYAERQLELAVRTSEARSGSVVVMDPSTGELLAVANYPTFNPNEARKGQAGDRKNRALTDQFEPGSTIKPFTMAGALASGVVSANDVIDCSTPLSVAGGTVHDAHRMDKLSMTEIISHSSNVGISKVAASLGRERLHRVLTNFGFGSPTSLDFPAEASGNLRPYQRWYPLEAATISFGQSMSASTLQLVMAMGAIANKGRLMEPILVKRVTDAHGQTVEEALPRVRQQVVPESVARTLTDMLVAVTSEGGTGTEAAIDGYLVAGKTGTAQKAEAKSGYTGNKFVSSFVGFAPAQKPRLAIAVVLDEPTVAHLASAVAAPVFKLIMEQSLRHLGVPAEGQKTGSEALARVAKARRSEQQAAWPLPENVEQPAPRGAAVGPGETLVPNLIGRSARAAVMQARRALLNVSVQGSGIVNVQQPAAGAVVQRGALVGLQLSPPTPDLPVPPLPSDLAELPRELLRGGSPQPSAAEPGALPGAVPRRRGQDG
jgi:cell division protein FtsI (penicillin-binding protein 3)